MSAEEILLWLESMHTLHLTVEALYVVDGYEVNIMYDDNPLRGPYKAETLKEAYELAAKN